MTDCRGDTAEHIIVRLLRHPPGGGFLAMTVLSGEVPERLIGAVSKTVIPKGIGGSNPSLSVFFGARREE